MFFHISYRALLFAMLKCCLFVSALVVQRWVIDCKFTPGLQNRGSKVIDMVINELQVFNSENDLFGLALFDQAQVWQRLIDDPIDVYCVIFTFKYHFINLSEDDFAEWLWRTLQPDALILTAIIEHSVHIDFPVFLFVELAGFHGFHLIKGSKGFNFLDIFSSVAKLDDHTQSLNLNFSDGRLLSGSFIVFQVFNRFESCFSVMIQNCHQFFNQTIAHESIKKLRNFARRRLSYRNQRFQFEKEMFFKRHLFVGHDMDQIFGATFNHETRFLKFLQMLAHWSNYGHLGAEDLGVVILGLVQVENNIGHQSWLLVNVVQDYLHLLFWLIIIDKVFQEYKKCSNYSFLIICDIICYDIIWVQKNWAHILNKFTLFK